jgi:hypothetical protein
MFIFYFQYLIPEYTFRVRDFIVDEYFDDELRGAIESRVEMVDELCAQYELIKNSGMIDAITGVKFVEEFRRDFPERKFEVDFLLSEKMDEAVKITNYNSDELRASHNHQMSSFEKPVVDSGFSSSAEPQSPNKHHHRGLFAFIPFKIINKNEDFRTEYCYSYRRPPIVGQRGSTPGNWSIVQASRGLVPAWRCDERPALLLYLLADGHGR